MGVGAGGSPSPPGQPRQLAGAITAAEAGEAGRNKAGDAAQAAVAARARRSHDQRVLRTVSAPYADNKMAAVAEDPLNERQVNNFLGGAGLPLVHFRDGSPICVGLQPIYSASRVCLYLRIAYFWTLMHGGANTFLSSHSSAEL